MKMMRMAWALCLALLLLAASPQAPAVDGTFRGKVVEPPENQPASPGWIFVEGRNRMLRRVEVSHAVIIFAEEVPVQQRRKCNSECLSAGEEVRITAHQDAAGEWRAKLVEILRVPTRVAQLPERPPSLPIFTPKFTLQEVTVRNVPASYRLREKSNLKYVSARRYNERVSLKRARFSQECIYEI